MAMMAMESCESSPGPEKRQVEETLHTYDTRPSTPGVKGYDVVRGGKVRGGEVHTRGGDIKWQDGDPGPLNEQVNGADVQDVLVACHHRLHAYLQSEEGHQCHKDAIKHIEDALASLQILDRERNPGRPSNTYKCMVDA